jgi:hypothetical protein
MSRLLTRVVLARRLHVRKNTVIASVLGISVYPLVSALTVQIIILTLIPRERG